MTSQIKTFLLLSLLTGLLMAIGRMVGGQGGLIIAFIFALVMNVGSYWFSDKIVLRMYGAEDVSPSQAPALHAIVEELAANAGIPKPRVVIIPQDSPNAFATGRNPEHAVVAVTEGILKLLSADELRGVVAHELAHIKNRDILIQSVAAVLGGVIMMLANTLRWGAIFGGGSSNDEDGGGSPLALIATSLLAPFAAMLIQMAISRSREYLADESGASISGLPMGLAGALEKLESWSQRVPLQGANPATENMFIVSPLAGAGGIMALFSTHPPIADRVARLREIAGRMGRGPASQAR